MTQLFCVKCGSSLIRGVDLDATDDKDLPPCCAEDGEDVADYMARGPTKWPNSWHGGYTWDKKHKQWEYWNPGSAPGYSYNEL